MITSSRVRTSAVVGALAIALASVPTAAAHAGQVSPYSHDYAFPAVSADDVYFAGWTPTTGTELFVTDGTDAGTRLVRDLYPGVRSGFEAGYSFDPEFTRVGDLTFFVAHSAKRWQLWRTDGTEAGTFRLTEHYGRPTELTAVGDRLYFTDIGMLMTSDGTVEGTYATGGDESAGLIINPYSLEVVGDDLILLANPEFQGVYEGVDIWRITGLEQGGRIGRIPVEDGDARIATDIRDLGDGRFGYLLYRPGSGKLLVTTSDGTEAGTRTYGAFSTLDIDSVVGFDGELFMTSYVVRDAGIDQRLWRTDSATGELVQVQKSLQGAEDNVAGITATADRLWVTRYDRGTKRETVYSTTDAATAPAKVADLDVTTRRIRNHTHAAAAVGDRLWVQQNGKLWLADATTASATALRATGVRSDQLTYAGLAATPEFAVLAYSDASVSGRVILSGGTTATTRQALPLAIPPAQPRPTIRGTAQVGKTLEVLVGKYSGTLPTFTYQWYRNGVLIEGATAKKYVITERDRGWRLSARVTASRPGFFPSLSTSANTATVPRVFTTVGTPFITGTPEVGATLTAGRGTWSPTANYAFQWFANGVRISGATSQKWTVTAGALGKQITVRVTGSRSGYLSETRTSEPVTITD